MAINGRDCMCAAQHEGQCSCGCDWTTTKEARLQALNADLLAANAKLKDALQDAVYEIQKLETEVSDE